MARKRGKRRTGEGAVFALAGLLLAYSVSSVPWIMVDPPVMLGNAMMSVTAAVVPNSDNTAAAQLRAYEQDLARREAALKDLEGGVSEQNRTALFSFWLSIALFALLALNYYFDWRRTRLQSASPRVVVS